MCAISLKGQRPMQRCYNYYGIEGTHISVKTIDNFFIINYYLRNMLYSLKAGTLFLTTNTPKKRERNEETS